MSNLSYPPINYDGYFVADLFSLINSMSNQECGSSFQGMKVRVKIPSSNWIYTIRNFIKEKDLRGYQKRHGTAQLPLVSSTQLPDQLL
jgi:hypothetical protein